MSLILVPLENLCTVSYSPSVVTMAPFCIISKIKRDRLLVENRDFFIPWHSTPLLGVPVGILSYRLVRKNYSVGQKLHPFIFAITLTNHIIFRKFLAHSH